MKIGNNNIDINTAINFANHDALILKRQKNNFLLSDYQINVLKNKGFNINNYTNVRDLLFDIENLLNDEFDDELDLIGNQIAEFIYYNYTKK